MAVSSATTKRRTQALGLLPRLRVGSEEGGGVPLTPSLSSPDKESGSCVAEERPPHTPAGCQGIRLLQSKAADTEMY